MSVFSKLSASPPKAKALFAAGVGLVMLIANMRQKAKESMRTQDDDDDLSSLVKHKLGKEKVAVNGRFFADLRRLLRIVVPSVWSKEAGLLLAQTLVLTVRTVFTVLTAALDGKIIGYMVRKEYAQFRNLLMWFLLAAFPTTWVNSMMKYLQSEIELSFRKRLNAHFTDLYMREMTYYKVGNLDSRVDNVAHCLTQDVERFSASLAKLYSSLTKPLLDIVLHAVQLSRGVGSAGPAIYVLYFLFSGTTLRLLSPAFGKLVAREQELEGSFRFSHARLIQNAEEVAFYGGERVERGVLRRAFAALARHLHRTNALRLPYGMLESAIIKYGGSAVGLLICALPVFFNQRGAAGSDGAAGDAGGGGGEGESVDSRTEQYVSNRRLLIGLAEAVGRILLSYREVTELAGYTARVHALESTFRDMVRGHYVRAVASNNCSSSSGGGDDDDEDAKAARTQEPSPLRVDLSQRGLVLEGDRIECVDVPIVTPAGDVLVPKLSMVVAPGTNLLIVGPNGCGKSSLFRILGGLWPCYGGQLVRPPRGGIFYVPQRPYLSMGTLREQITYPDTESRLSDEELMTLLRDVVRLEHIVVREGGWDVRADWKDVLSGGEKQRVAMARMFYHAPRVGILDECTSAVSMDVEGTIYSEALARGITLITVSHRHSLWKYHTHILRMGRDQPGGYTFSPLTQDMVDRAANA